MARERLVVVGGDAAGMSAAANARRRRPAADLAIDVYEQGPHASYAACGIPYYIGGLVPSEQRLIARRVEQFEAEGIGVHLRHQVEGIDPAQRRVLVKPLDGGEARWEPYDHLLLATGSMPVRPQVPGIDARGVFGLNTLESGIAVHRFLEEERPRRAVIVGGGYIGLEMAEALIMRGLQVALVEKEEQVMLTLDADMAAPIARRLEELGVELRLGEALTAFETADGRLRAVVTEKGTISCDMAVLGLGVRPRSELAREAGIPLGVRGAVVVNERMQTEVPGIWAAGDCAQTFHLVSRRPFWVALGTVANKQGRVAGINLGGGYATFPGVVGTAITKVCELEIARTGLQEREIAALGWESVVVRIEAPTRAHYYPDAGRATVKLLAERGSGRLLGGQIVGTDGAGKRIDVVATALHAGLTVEEFLHLDLAYAPPFSPVWDPLLVAARQLAGSL
ncbi:MAG: FAD-dependent oxidoreductase [Dehalococcoidia bacterium]|nr:FAD-dependent oxidoreductase [Dehalococcoidia bacterium]MDW8009924.1 FAD-dependent oxidoreductase [Chloroflexota bacterium]